MGKDGLILEVAPIVRGCTLPRSADGRPLGTPACVLSVEGTAIHPAHGGVDVTVTQDKAGIAGEIAAAFQAWRSSRSDTRNPHLLPGVVTVTRGDARAAFILGSDPDDAARRLESSRRAARFEAFTPEIPPAHEPGSAAGRERVVKGRVARVTGGAQGIGEEIVRGLAASGAVVYAADVNGAGAARLSTALNEKHGRTAVIPITIDVTDEASVNAAFARVAERTGGLDLCVSNAGVLRAESMFEQSIKDFRFVTEVNYVGFFLVAQAAARLMRAAAISAPGWNTDIIQVNSKSGLAGSNRNAAYAGGKFGGIGLTESFALELVDYGIKVNAVCPGNFFDGPLWSDPETGLFVQYLRTGKVPGARSVADVRAHYEGKVPMKRGCRGVDVMRAIYAIVEQEYETGQAVPVTGGQIMLR